MQFAIVQTGGKQYCVHPEQKIKVEKLAGEEGDHVAFDHVLLVSDDTKTEIGAPYVSGAKVEGIITAQGRHKKVIVFKYHSKTRYRKKKGHRQPFTEVEIKRIIS